MNWNDSVLHQTLAVSAHDRPLSHSLVLQQHDACLRVAALRGEDGQAVGGGGGRILLAASPDEQHRHGAPRPVPRQRGSALHSAHACGRHVCRTRRETVRVRQSLFCFVSVDSKVILDNKQTMSV